ncbi:proteoglycan 4 [Thalassophryne amazonica]|uniref:proteoglycan 4 n=1 Tax=Thalassophryne amazonica TaxID=390379 RepID=UPI00147135CD|nr:proteoglycan 4 [Thalassophryne amazonica]
MENADGPLKCKRNYSLKVLRLSPWFLFYNIGNICSYTSGGNETGWCYHGNHRTNSRSKSFLPQGNEPQQDSPPSEPQELLVRRLLLLPADQLLPMPPKPSTSAASKTDGSSLSKTTRPVASRPASAMTRPTKATTKPSTSVLAKTAAPRVTTAPSSGRTTTVQSSKPTAVKDVCQPHSATVAKKPATSAAPKKPEASKTPGTTKLNSAAKKPMSTQVADPKQSKTQDPLKLTKKPAVTTAQVRAVNKQPSGRPPLALPVNKPTVSNSQAKKGLKPTVPPFTAIKKTDVPVHSGPGKVQSSTSTPAAAALPTVPKEAAVVLPQPSLFATSAPEEASSKGFDKETPQDNGAAWSPHSPERTTIPQISPNHEQTDASTPPLVMQERPCVPVEVQLSEVASRTEPSEPVYSLADCTTSKSLPTAAAPQMFPSDNLNEEEDEEEKEGSQLVSVSEMSGATQPTEESRPGSAGPLGGCAWRAGGALLSELDSEEVSGSQQGASELSAPGVLEGTESTDDLGDGSLKGAMDIEGASAGSPDFEKVPDIPVNDFEEEEDDEDDYDRVCDMDVGSEQAEDPQRPRHDNDVDDDEDVEMASEGVTESGLESYGNADEDDFVEDERLDNLNRLAQLPPPLTCCPQPQLLSGINRTRL